MEQALDIQVAAMIFLSGTRCLATGGFAGDVDKMSEIDEDSEEPNPHPMHFTMYRSQLESTVYQFDINKDTNGFKLGN